MGPLHTVFQGADSVLLRVEVFPGLPLVDDRTVGGDLLDGVTEHTFRVRVAGRPTFNAGGYLR